jgi:hypothetical protein
MRELPPSKRGYAGGVGGVDRMPAFYAIIDPGHTQAWALLRIEAMPVIERWVPGEGWVETWHFHSYFLNGEPGSHLISDGEAERRSSVLASRERCEPQATVPFSAQLPQSARRT